MAEARPEASSQKIAEVVAEEAAVEVRNKRNGRWSEVFARFYLQLKGRGSQGNQSKKS